MHHRSDAYLNVTSNGFEHPVDGLFAVAIPTAAIAALGLWLNNFWAMFFPLHLVVCVFVFGERPGDSRPLLPPPVSPVSRLSLLLLLPPTDQHARPSATDRPPHPRNP